MPRLVKVVVTTGNQKYITRQTQGVYTGQIATVTGITESVGVESKDEPVIPVAELIRTNKVARYRAAYVVNNRRRYQDILVAEEKQDTARQELVNKTLNNRQIVDVVIKRDAYIR